MISRDVFPTISILHAFVNFKMSSGVYVVFRIIIVAVEWFDRYIIVCR
jgi:hypothetical protein